MNYAAFWEYFNGFAAPLLQHRAGSLRMAFEHLEKLGRPACIVETGCVRNQGTFTGEGQSTVLFDKFSECVPDTLVHSVDISPESTSKCKSIVSNRIQVHTSDSVTFLRHQCVKVIQPYSHIDLLYLDSFDLDIEDPHDSAIHHIKELLAAAPLINTNTFILVDDSPTSANFFMQAGQLTLVSPQRISGKGKYIASYMQDIGSTPIYQGYQAAWMGM
jgi:hypothetical protein